MLTGELYVTCSLIEIFVISKVIKMKILLIDDNAERSLDIVEILQKRRCECQGPITSSKKLSEIPLEFYDVDFIIADWGVDGVDTLEFFLHNVPSVPFIIVTEGYGGAGGLTAEDCQKYKGEDSPIKGAFIGVIDSNDRVNWKKLLEDALDITNDIMKKNEKFNDTLILPDAFVKEDNYYLELYAALDILIQGLIIIKIIKEKKKLSSTSLVNGKEHHIINEIIFDEKQYEIIKNRPCRWFFECWDDLEEIFKKDNSEKYCFKNYDIEIKSALAQLSPTSHSNIVQTARLLNDIKKSDKCILWKAKVEGSRVIDDIKACFKECTYWDDKDLIKELNDEVFLEKAHFEYIKSCEAFKEKNIVNKFLNFRSYVSHTICENRFFKGLRDGLVERKVEKCLKDSGRWPLLGDIVKIMFDSGETLFGLYCPEVFVKEKSYALELLREIESFHKNVLNEIEIKKDEFLKIAEKLRIMLKGMPKKFEQFHAKFNPDKCIDYLKGKRSSELWDEFQAELHLHYNDILPLMVKRDKSPEYKVARSRYWEAHVNLLHLIHKCIVASVLENNQEVLNKAERAQNALKGSVYKDLTLFCESLHAS